MPNRSKLAIVGTVGVPGKYGGFETLVDNLVRFAEERCDTPEITVYCSAKFYDTQADSYHGARLIYVPLNANGIQSIPYDIWSMFSAVWRGHDELLILGVSGCVCLPLLRLVSRVRIVTNIDGIEWRRDKWNGLAKWVLRTSEKLAVRFSHKVIADNWAIADYVKQTYDRGCEVIAYGGDHALDNAPADIADLGLPESYALGLCRIEPENNIEMILQAFADTPGRSLVFVGNWDGSAFGRDLKRQFANLPNIHILDPVYEAERLRAIRDNATLYVHGHSAGGTNPSLVEMMYFAVPIAAFDCSYNRYTTEDSAYYFASASQLTFFLESPEKDSGQEGQIMAEVARRRYTWDIVGKAYFDVL